MDALKGFDMYPALEAHQLCPRNSSHKASVLIKDEVGERERKVVHKVSRAEDIGRDWKRI